MLEQINQLIALNLQLIHSSESNSLCLRDFKDSLGNKLNCAKSLADIMLQKELIVIDSEETMSYKLTILGTHICENGGWLKQVEKQNSLKTVRPKKSNKKEHLKSGKTTLELIIAGLVLLFLSLLIASCI